MKEKRTLQIEFNLPREAWIGMERLAGELEYTVGQVVALVIEEGMREPPRKKQESKVEKMVRLKKEREYLERMENRLGKGK